MASNELPQMYAGKVLVLQYSRIVSSDHHRVHVQDHRVQVILAYRLTKIY